MPDSSSPLSVIFAGTPTFSATCLEALLREAGINIVAVYTQPDRPKGRGKKLIHSPVKSLALEKGIPVYQPVNFRSPESLEQLEALNPDLMIVVAYGLLLPKEVLEVPKYGCINVHASLLPRWRGAAPIERAIEAGDNETGITIMQMDEGLDTGPMLLKTERSIDPGETGDSLREKLALDGSAALVSAVRQLIAGEAQAEQQNEELATYAAKLGKPEACIDWTLSAKVLDRKIRAYSSSNVCWCLLNNERLKIWDSSTKATTLKAEPGTILNADKKGVLVACGEGAINLERLQLPGKKAMRAAEMLNARKTLFSPGTRLK